VQIFPAVIIHCVLDRPSDYFHMTRFFILASTLSLVSCRSGSQLEEEKMNPDFVFASCYRETRSAPGLATIARISPGVMVWMGDTIYGDTDDMAVLRGKYAKLNHNEHYRRLKEKATVIGTWDDHDYGLNNGGKEFSKRAESQQVFLDFLGVPPNDKRRTRAGVYSTEVFGKKSEQVRVILLDTRYHRDSPGPNGTILGEEQWQWLEKVLRESEAQAHIVVSSVPVIPKVRGFEQWGNFSKERDRFFKLLAEPGIPPVLLMSGDRHRAELTRNDDLSGYPVYEITSSSLNQGYGGKSHKNSERIGKQIKEANFASIDFEWAGGKPEVTATIFSDEGKTLLTEVFTLEK